MRTHVLLGICAGVAVAFSTPALSETTTSNGDPAPADAGPSRGFERFQRTLPDFDVRLQKPEVAEAIAVAMGSPLQVARAQRGAGLAAAIDGGAIDFHETLGGAQYLRSTRGLLTDPVAGPVDAKAIAREFVTAHADVFRTPEAQLAEANIVREAVSPRNGLTTLWWTQRIGGVDVVGAEMRANVTADGRIASIGSTMLAEPEGGFGPQAATLSREQAIHRAAADLGLELKGEPAAEGHVGSDHRQKFGRMEETHLPIDTRLVYFPLTPDVVRLAYEVMISARGSSDVYELTVDAQSGEVLSRRNLTWYGAGTESATYRVYTSDSPAPLTPGPNAPDGSQGVEVSRDLVTTISLDAVASPEGWIPDGSNTTVGNNVDSHLDLNNDDQPDLPRPVGSPFRQFDFPLDLTLAPSAYRDASVTQLFYWCNWYHDRLYQLGFTEPFANFQEDNFGRGGAQGDSVSADCQDGSGVDNANFFTTSDGSVSRVQMYLWNGPTPFRDGSLDAHIVIHELTHGTSIRLHGTLGSGTNQSRGMGEGWSDFYALSMLAEPGDDPDGVYGMGGYGTYLGGPGFTQNYYFGIRRFPYSTNLEKSPLTYADIDGNQFAFDPAIPRNPVYGPSTPVTVHNLGEIWCAMLWECRANLIATHGFAGNEIMLQLVTDGMKLAPAAPTFIQSRDAILLADMINNDGANQCELWSGFAKRGIGMGASGPGTSSTSGVVESFEAPEGLDFDYEDGAAPDRAAPISPFSFPVAIEATCGDPLIADSAQIFISVNGAAFAPLPLSEESPGEYMATLPGFNCGDTVEYYISASTTSQTITDPPGAPAEVYGLSIISAEATPFSDDFEADLGWTVSGTVTDGAWDRGAPIGGGDRGDPLADGDGSGQCYLTDNVAGNSDVDGGTTILTSPAFDATGPEGSDAFLVYWRWYSNDFGAEPNADSMPIEISSDDGANWTLLEDVSENTGQWTLKRFRIADFVERTSTVRVRFQARDLGGGSVVEAGVDGVAVEVLSCLVNPKGADLNGDGVVGAPDLALLLGAWGPCPSEPAPCAGDLDGDGVVGAADLAIMLGSWG